MMFRLIATGIFLLIFSVSILAQEGPMVPCVGCENLTQAPFPETGLWVNSADSGSGFSFEIQNGVLAGHYYGYNASGQPEWQLLSGILVRSEQEGFQWELETQFIFFEGGSCLGCEHQVPTNSAGPSVKLEFQQRNYLRVTVDENPAQYFVPFVYGSAGKQYFSEQTPYVFPEYGDDTYFVLIRKPNTDPPSPWLWETATFPVGKARVGSGTRTGQIYYQWWIPQGPPGPDVFGDLIVCELDTGAQQPVCTIKLGGKEYLMPIANMGDSHFFAEAEDGSTIEGYRINYD